MILEPIWEHDFVDESIGLPSLLSCHAGQGFAIVLCSYRCHRIPARTQSTQGHPGIERSAR